MSIRCVRPGRPVLAGCVPNDNSLLWRRMNTNQQTRRFFVADLSGDEIRPSPGEVHHALHVLRLKSGQEVELFDGAGNLAGGVIGRINRREIVINVTNRQSVQRIGPEIDLATATPKGKRLDWLAEKASELGAASLQRVIFDRSPPAVKTRSASKDDKLFGHCVSAAKQSGLNFLPKLPPPVTLAELLDNAASPVKLLGDLEPDAISLNEAVEGKTSASSIMLLVGPEGGLTESERKASIDAGFAPVRIARTTLRTETAAIALLAATAAICPFK